MSVFPHAYHVQTWAILDVNIFQNLLMSAAGFPYEYRMNPWVRLKSGHLYTHWGKSSP
jgi:hypothetical protein